MDPIDEGQVHRVFGLLREHVTEAAHDFHVRVADELSRAVSAHNSNPGILRMALSALLQTTNLVLDALAGQIEDDDDDDDASS